MRAPGSANHHDLAFFTIGSDAEDSEAGRSQVGLYHLAWEVPTLDDLELHRQRLADAGALRGASDHGVNKSLYAHDPDGIEFEVMWLVPSPNGATSSTRPSSDRSTSPLTSPASGAIGSPEFDPRRRSGHEPRPVTAVLPLLRRRRVRRHRPPGLPAPGDHRRSAPTLLLADRRRGYRVGDARHDENEQLGIVVRGALDFRIGERDDPTRSVLREGDVYLAPVSVWHGDSDLHRRRRVRRVLDPRRVRPATADLVDEPSDPERRS